MAALCGTSAYDVLANQYRDMLAAGIIDPVKGARSAFENACSLAAMMLTTEALVTDIPKPENAKAGAGGEYGEMI
ncbi:MAG: hypothetical protein KJZ93_28220 [Caldilineaceae bacterium]|nr:hypothetical protein [Caldilineaceae bacterium]